MRGVIIKNSDDLIIADQTFHSRLLLGTARYPNSQIMLDSVVASGTEMVTVARQSA